MGSTPPYQSTLTSMFFNFRLFFSSALALLAIVTIAAAEPVPAEKRQIESLFSSLTGDVGSGFSSLTNDVASGWDGATSLLGSLGDGVYGTLTSVGGSVYTVLSSEGGDAVTLAGDLPGVVTSFAGEQVTILTDVLPTNTGNGNAALPRNSFTLLDIGLALGGVALGALITFA